jgi:hypothetical protein
VRSTTCTVVNHRFWFPPPAVYLASYPASHETRGSRSAPTSKWQRLEVTAAIMKPSHRQHQSACFHVAHCFRHLLIERLPVRVNSGCCNTPKNSSLFITNNQHPLPCLHTAYMYSSWPLVDHTSSWHLLCSSSSSSSDRPSHSSPAEGQGRLQPPLLRTAAAHMSALHSSERHWPSSKLQASISITLKAVRPRR